MQYVDVRFPKISVFKSKKGPVEQSN